MTRRVLNLIPLAVLAFGCAAPSGEKSASTPTPPPAVPGVTPPESPELFLLHRGLSYKLGTTWEDAEAVFERPRSAFDFSELPAAFQPPYRGRGWEGSRESFGVILYQQRSVLAMQQFDRADRAQLDELVKAYETALPNLTPQYVTGKQVNAWFWQVGDEQLMVAGTDVPQSGLHIAVVLGMRPLMQRVGATPAQLESDIANLNRRFEIPTRDPKPESREPNVP
ncbi:MAG: hypothetical protein SFX74_09025 [Fimbriimonadaceae bacterium]|nr:hypothetical protein [Fimbriimonadaceae bacterium]